MSRSSTARSEPFPSTHWSVVMLAGQGADPVIRRRAIESVLVQYLPAMRSYLRRQHRLNLHDADELLQNFVTDAIVQGDLIARADKRLGRFRSLLSAAMARYVASYHRRRMATKRLPDRGISLDAIDKEPDHQESPPAEFDLAWAKEVIAQTLERMQSECRANGDGVRWEIFEAQLLGPLLHQSPTPPYEELVAKLGLTSPSQAYNTLATAKRMFERLLRESVARYTPDEDVADEIAHLRQILARGGAS